MRIKELRENAGLQQKELALELGIPSNTLSQYENSKREPNNEMLGRIANYFNVTTDYLLGRDSWVRCPICHKTYDPLNIYDSEAHKSFHDRFLKAEDKYGKLIPYQEASDLRNHSIKKYTNHSSSLSERIEAYGDYLKYDYLIYIMNNSLDLSLEDFETYCKKDIGLAETKKVCDELDPKMYEMLVSKYGVISDENYHLTSRLNTPENHMVKLFNKLNENNKERTISYAEKLLKLQNLDDEQDEMLLQAARPHTGVEYSSDEAKSDLDSMSDENF